MMLRGVIALFGVVGAVGVFVGAIGDWVETGLGGVSGSMTIGLFLAVAAIAAAALHLVALADGPRWPLLWGVCTGGAAAAAGILVTIAVQLVNRSTWLLSQFVENRTALASTDLSGPTSVSRGWGATSLLVFGSLLLVVSLVQLGLPRGRPVAPRKLGLGRRLRAELTQADAPVAPAVMAQSPRDDLL